MTIRLGYERENTNRRVLCFYLQCKWPLLSFIFYSLLYNTLWTMCTAHGFGHAAVCVYVCVCVVDCLHVYTTAVDWQGLWHLFHPCQNDRKGTGKRENLSYLFACAQWQRSDREGTAKHSHHSPPRASIPPFTGCKGHRQHNETVIINTSRPEQSGAAAHGPWNGHSDRTHWGMTFQMSDAGI